MQRRFVVRASALVAARIAGRPCAGNPAYADFPDRRVEKQGVNRATGSVRRANGTGLGQSPAFRDLFAAATLTCHGAWFMDVATRGAGKMQWMGWSTLAVWLVAAFVVTEAMAVASIELCRSYGCDALSQPETSGRARIAAVR